MLIELRQVMKGYSYLIVNGVMVTPKSVIFTGNDEILEACQKDLETKKSRNGTPYKDIIRLQVFDVNPDPEVAEDFTKRLGARFIKNKELDEVEKEGIKDYQHFMNMQPVEERAAAKATEYPTLKIDFEKTEEKLKARGLWDEFCAVTSTSERRYIARTGELAMTASIVNIWEKITEKKDDSDDNGN